MLLLHLVSHLLVIGPVMKVFALCAGEPIADAPRSSTVPLTGEYPVSPAIPAQAGRLALQELPTSHDAGSGSNVSSSSSSSDDENGYRDAGSEAPLSDAESDSSAHAAVRPPLQVGRQRRGSPCLTSLVILVCEDVRYHIYKLTFVII